MSTTNPFMAIAAVSCAAFAGSVYAGSDSKVMAGSLLAAPIDALVPAVSAYSGDDDHSRGRVSGRRLFERETFGGNGRTCLTCHGRETGTVSPADADPALLPAEEA